MTVLERLLARDEGDLADVYYRLTGEDQPDWSSQALAEGISRAMEERPARLRLCLGLEAVDYIRPRAGLPIREEDLDTELRPWRILDDLTRFGLCDVTEEGWLPDIGLIQLLKLDRGERDRLQRAEIVFAMADGLLACMGMLEESVLLDQLSRYVPFLTLEELRQALITRYGLQTWYRTEALVPGDPEETWICYPELEEADTLLSALDSPEAASLPYANPGMVTLISAHALGMPLAAEALDNCANRLEAAGLAPQEIWTLIEDAVFETLNDAGTVTGAEIVSRLMKPARDESSRQAAQALRNLCDTLPRWTLKGHTPQEAAELTKAARVGQLHALPLNADGPRVIPFPVPSRPVQPIPPDGPCPCGSGKKYRECHGLVN